MVEYAKKVASFCRMYLAEINDKKTTSFHSTIYFTNRCNRFTGMDVFCATGFIQLSLTPFILDIISPKNETPDLIYIYLAYCYIDNRKYRVLIRFRMTYTIILPFFVFVSWLIEDWKTIVLAFPWCCCREGELVMAMSKAYNKQIRW